MLQMSSALFVRFLLTLIVSLGLTMAPGVAHAARTTDIGDARRRVGSKVALQGNMDPSTLYASPERIRAEVATILENYGTGTGHVFNLGHGIHQHVEPERAKVFVEAVHELSAKYHQ